MNYFGTRRTLLHFFLLFGRKGSGRSLSLLPFLSCIRGRCRRSWGFPTNWTIMRLGAGLGESNGRAAILSVEGRLGRRSVFIVILVFILSSSSPSSSSSSDPSLDLGRRI